MDSALRAWFSAHQRIALGFSGGVDSSYLLYAAMACGVDVRAYYVKTQFQPRFEYDDAARLARELGADFSVIELDALSPLFSYVLLDLKPRQETES